MKRMVIGVGLGLAFAALGALTAPVWLGGVPWASPSAAAEPGDDGAPAAPHVETVESVASPYGVTLRLRGVTEAARRVTVEAETEGLVVSDPLRKGAVVEAGALLCEIEPGERPARLAEAKARLAEAEAAAAASASLARKGFSAELTRARDVAALESAKAAVTLAELDIARTRIAAPFAGRLETDAAELGARLGLGQPCATVIALDPIHFVGFASEAEVGAIALGQKVRATLVDGRSIESAISFVGQSADARTRTFRVEATAANPSDRPGGAVRDGASARLEISTGVATAHRVPRSAILLSDAGEIGVMLVVDGAARFQTATVVSDKSGYVVIVGPPERAEVIVAGQYYVSDGASVRATRTPMAEIGDNAAVETEASAAPAPVSEPTQ